MNCAAVAAAATLPDGLLPATGRALAVRFAANPGLFVFHCHNLEHEDAGTMATLAVS